MKRTLLVLAFAVTSLPGHAQRQTADLVLRHGTVLTVDAKDSVAQAVAIRDGRIVAVGTDTVVAKLIGPKTKVIFKAFLELGRIYWKIRAEG